MASSPAVESVDHKKKKKTEKEKNKTAYGFGWFRWRSNNFYIQQTVLSSSLWLYQTAHFINGVKINKNINKVKTKKASQI